MRLALFLLLIATPASAQVEPPEPMVTLSDAVWGLAIILATILVLAYIGSRR